ncbi:MAG: hypothetical protein ACLGIS_14875, partial [Actinomycetes bacterium]
MNNSAQHPRKVHLTEQPVAVVRERVPMASLTDFFGRAFSTVMAAAQKQGASPAGPPFALYRGMPSESVDVEAGSRRPNRARRNGRQGWSGPSRNCSKP